MRQIFQARQIQIFGSVFLDSFNSCYLVSLLILALFSRQAALLLTSDYNIYFFVLLPFVNAGLSFGVLEVFYRIIRKRVSFSHIQYKKQAQIVSVITGIMTIYAAAFQLVAFLTFLIVMFVTVVNVRSFMRRLWRYLEPDKILTKEDMFDFCAFFVSIVTAFIVLNLTTAYLHDFLGAGPAFNFQPGVEGILDAVYFTFVSMTTVGFGDIVPLTPFAKIIVSFECMASYILFALFIGVVNRGIMKSKP